MALVSCTVTSPMRAPLGGAKARTALRPSSGIAMHTRPSITRSLRTTTLVRAAPQPTPEQLEQMKAAYEEAMKDPEQAKQIQAMQEAMKNPEYVKQMQQMQQMQQSMMQNPSVQAKMEALKSDPEFAEEFAEAQKQGMAGLMKLMQDEDFLMRLSKKLGGPPEAAMQQTPPPPPAAAAPVNEPEIENLLDAAKYGDLEAIEDFIAIGKDVNMVDEENRTPLHYACAQDQKDIVGTLAVAGADLEAVDTKENTPLHYAAGYGRIEVCKVLIERGANTAAKNESGKTPLDLVKMHEQNPVNGDEDLLELLGA